MAKKLVDWTPTEWREKAAQIRRAAEDSFADGDPDECASDMMAQANDMERTARAIEAAVQRSK